MSELPIPKRKYYSARRGTAQPLSRGELATAVFNVIDFLMGKDYLVEQLGYDCVDLGHVSGLLGKNPAAHINLQIGPPSFWPPTMATLMSCSYDDVFTFLEYLYDLISAPVDGTMHSYNSCGMHWDIFDSKPAQAEYVQLINRTLARIETGYIMTADGEIQVMAEPGLDELLANAPKAVAGDDKAEVTEAIARFRSRASSWNTRKDAVVALAGVLERNKNRIHIEMLSSDEKDLFHIANRFSIRHQNDEQKGDYEKALWLTWIFYVYLATIALVGRLASRTQ